MDDGALERVRKLNGSRDNFGRYIGIEYCEVTPDRVRAVVNLTSNHMQVFGRVHGGVYTSVAEEVASCAGMKWLGAKGTVVGVNNNTDLLRASRSGTLHATCTPVHRGRSQQLWRVDIIDDEGKQVAVSQVRLANVDPSRQ